ncbi:MAG: IclR family transcriptional regulator [Nitratireductor sp.]|nr:IclR family transcriptional regulator [Nitratireductor sp.]
MEDTRTKARDAKSGERETGTLGKAMAVLDIVASSNQPLRFTDILLKSDQPRGTLHRQISNLVEEGLLAVNRDHSYELGMTLLKFAARAWAGNHFRAIAEPHLARLHEETGETVHLGVLRGTEVIYLDKVEGRQAVRMYSQIGNASPVYCTGVGKAAMSALPPERIEALVNTINFRKFTDHTITTPRALIAELADIRAAGVAYDREEHELGIRCVAAPIWSNDGNFHAGVSVTGPAYRVTFEALDAWKMLVLRTAQGIMADMETRLGPRA